MDQKFDTLAELVREARAEDKRTIEALEAASTAWKTANKILTDRIAVLDQYVAGLVNDATRL